MWGDRMSHAARGRCPPLPNRTLPVFCISLTAFLMLWRSCSCVIRPRAHRVTLRVHAEGSQSFVSLSWLLTFTYDEKNSQVFSGYLRIRKLS